MVFPEIKIKEKRKSFNLKMKISKKEVKGIFLSSEEVTELKQSILDELNYEVENLIRMMVEDEELSDEQSDAFESALDRVSVSVAESEITEGETEETSEEVSEEVSEQE